MRESALQAKVIGALRHRGGYWVVNSPAAYTPSGRPDIEGCYRGAYVGIELKKPKTGTTSPAQKLCIARIKAAGGFAFTANSLEAVMEMLDAIDAWMLVLLEVSR